MAEPGCLAADKAPGDAEHEQREYRVSAQLVQLRQEHGIRARRVFDRGRSLPGPTARWPSGTGGSVGPHTIIDSWAIAPRDARREPLMILALGCMLMIRTRLFRRGRKAALVADEGLSHAITAFRRRRRRRPYHDSRLGCSPGTAQVVVVTGGWDRQHPCHGTTWALDQRAAAAPDAAAICAPASGASTISSLSSNRVMSSRKIPAICASGTNAAPVADSATTAGVSASPLVRSFWRRGDNSGPAPALSLRTRSTRRAAP